MLPPMLARSLGFSLSFPGSLSPSRPPANGVPALPVIARYWCPITGTPETIQATQPLTIALDASGAVVDVAAANGERWHPSAIGRMAARLSPTPKGATRAACAVFPGVPVAGASIPEGAVRYLLRLYARQCLPWSDVCARFRALFARRGLGTVFMSARLSWYV